MLFEFVSKCNGNLEKYKIVYKSLLSCWPLNFKTDLKDLAWHMLKGQSHLRRFSSD